MELMVCGELLMVIAPSYMLGSIRDSMDLEFYKIYCGGTDSMHSLQVPEP